MSNFAKYGIAGIVSFVVISAIFGDAFGSSEESARAARVAQKNQQIRAQHIVAAKEAVPLLIESGLVYRVEPNSYRAYVDEEYWSQQTVDAKVTAAAALGYFIQDANGDTLGIDIYGAHSGKKLGEWSNKAGFTPF